MLEIFLRQISRTQLLGSVSKLNPINAAESTAGCEEKPIAFGAFHGQPHSNRRELKRAENMESIGNRKEPLRERKFSLSNPHRTESQCLTNWNQINYNPIFPPEMGEEVNSPTTSAMPWFGMDIGGTLAKLVYFEPKGQEDCYGTTLEEERDLIKKIRKYLVGNLAYGELGIRDAHAELKNAVINGRVGILHFIRFPTKEMPAFISLAKRKGLAMLSSTICATGGGAHKFDAQMHQELNLRLFKFDELESLIQGMEFLIANNPEECYFWENPLSDDNFRTQIWTSGCEKRGVPYPYLVVNIGSGVSILAVNGERDFRRVSGSSLGGGLFHGLCCLLTDCKTFEEALQLAAQGDNRNVDKLVKDIYGGDYDLFGLPGDTVAASFAQVIDPEKRANASKADLARAALVSVTNNIASIARLCAKSESIERVIFVGNFLRVNPIASRRLTFGMDYWSGGQIKALFMQHEGYFGAIGCLLELMRLSERRRHDKMNGVQNGDSLYNH